MKFLINRLQTLVRREEIVYVIAFLIFLFWFLLAKDNYFHWDEWEYLLNFKDLPYYIFHQTHEQFAFIQILHHFILFKLFGLTYWPFQLSENIFHALNSVLLYKIVKHETKRRDLARIAMILFGFSSVSVENLNNSAAISQVLAGFLLFSAFFLFQKFEKTRKFLLVACSAVLLVLSPMGHGFTLLYPFAFAYLAAISKTRDVRIIGLYLFSGLVVLFLTSTFGKNLSDNINFTAKYFIWDI